MKKLDPKIKLELENIGKTQGYYNLRFLEDEVNVGGMGFTVEVAVFRKKFKRIRKVLGGYFFDVAVSPYIVEKQGAEIVLCSSKTKDIGFANFLKSELEEIFPSQIDIRSQLGDDLSYLPF